MKRLNFILFFLFVSISLTTIAQFDPKNYDKKLLEHEIKVLIDSTRKAHKLHSLFNDSILYVASDYHSQYLQKKKVLSHNQTENKDRYSPQDRANYFGAPSNYFVGENVAFTVYNTAVKVKDRIYKTTTYKEIARSLVYGWINSKGHFKNIIHPDYQITGLSIAIDPVLNRVYACQKFAHVLYTYAFHENKSFFPYSDVDQTVLKKSYENEKYPFKLRSDKVEKCESCRDEWEYYPTISVRVKNNNFILRIENTDFVKSLIQGKNDGFAVEIVPFDAFACGNPAYEEEPSRRNEMKRTSGQLLEPVYRDDLIKGFKRRKKAKDINFVKHIFTRDSTSFFKRFGNFKLTKFEAKYFEYKLGKIPKNLQGWWNHNLVYIKDKQICHVVYLTNYPGKIHSDFLDVAYFPPIPVNNYDFRLEHFSDTVELYYEAGQTTTKSTAFKTLIKRYEDQSLTIKNIQIDGLSSIEGDSLTNEKLHRERAENILNELQKITPSAEYSIHSTVAWNQFYESIKDHPKWKFLHSMARSEISAYLSNPKNERPSEILSKQRKSTIIINTVKELSAKTADYYVNRDIKQLYQKDKNGRLYCTNMNGLRAIYQKAFYLSTVDTLSEKNFLKIHFDDLKDRSHELDHDYAFYQYHYLHKDADKAKKIALESKVESIFQTCGAPDHLSPEFHYLSALLIGEKIKNQGKKTEPNSPEIQKAFDRLNLLLDSYNLDSTFTINVAKTNLNIINILCTNIDSDQILEYQTIVNNSLIQIIEYYRNAALLNPELVVKLAQFLCYFQNVPLAIELCYDYLYDNEVLKLYLPIAYSHSSYLTSNDELVFESDFHRLLLEAKQPLSAKEWCSLFYGKEGIPFQVMDNAQLHTKFCETCPDRVKEIFREE